MPCQHSHISVPNASRSERISNCPLDNGGTSRMLLEVSLPSLDSLSRITVAKNDVHINEHGHSVLTNLIGRLTAYNGPFEGLQNKAESHESNTIRLLAQDHIGGPLADSSGGKILNKDITSALEKLDQLRPMLHISLEPILGTGLETEKGEILFDSPI
ncbi:uncharacterized protein RAG0_09365 [Rhynchosporium agropyri]|uniref:Uncharacterized protein n=1 Tax=Rhynchosporium agropyri TaxID=914238 RepID=A0A1E1KV76_9HELO|nr:uncharacterized protein RAG0_09365 [Rhynchosporium agropyri]